jgi:hypothetical protein
MASDRRRLHESDHSMVVHEHTPRHSDHECSLGRRVREDIAKFNNGAAQLGDVRWQDPLGFSSVDEGSERLFGASRQRYR